jgi:hypothetical protein
MGDEDPSDIYYSEVVLVEEEPYYDEITILVDGWTWNLLESADADQAAA